MSDENTSNSMLTFLLIFMLGFFFSKLMPDICRSMTRSGIMDNVANPSNGILQGFKVGAHDCGPQPQPFRVGGQVGQQPTPAPPTAQSSGCGGR